MANAVYPLYKQNLLAGTSGYDIDTDTTTDGPYVSLIDGADYTYSTAHDFYNDAVAGEVGTPQFIDNPTVTNGTFDGADVTFTSVSGDPVEILIIYRHNSGANSTWPLVLYEDTSVTGLPVTPNGGNIVITWNASGIFTISDRRLKTDIVARGKLGPLTVFEYSYLDDPQRFVGVMAQDVVKVLPGAVIEFPTNRGPRMAVNYNEVVEKLAA